MRLLDRRWSSGWARGVLLVGLVACGDDPPPPPPPAPPPGPPARPAPGKPDDKNKLQPRMHVEEKVTCPVPEKPTGPACKPDTPTCDPGRYCLQVENNWFCEPCPERDSIR